MISSDFEYIGDNFVYYIEELDSIAGFVVFTAEPDDTFGLSLARRPEGSRASGVPEVGGRKQLELSSTR